MADLVAVVLDLGFETVGWGSLSLPESESPPYETRPEKKLKLLGFVDIRDKEKAKQEVNVVVVDEQSSVMTVTLDPKQDEFKLRRVRPTAFTITMSSTPSLPRRHARRSRRFLLFTILSLLSLSIIYTPVATATSIVDVAHNVTTGPKGSGRAGGSTSTHTNNWAVLVCSSRYWFNYRHMANALGMYRTVKRLGIPDSNIILMLADDAACNTRNSYPGSVFAEKGRHLDLYGENIEVDYRGYEVTVENFIRVLTGRVDPSVPRSKRLLTDERSNIFVFMTGHGGNEFLKFQDNEEISAHDIADAFEQMHQKKRYNEIFFMIDTCQANSMYSKFYSPNILATGSSKVAESSYSYEHDNDVGVSVIDAYTHFVLDFMEGINKTSQTSMQDLFTFYDPVKIKSHPGVRSDLFKRPLDKTLITDFFGGVAQAEVVDTTSLPPPSVQPSSRSSADTGSAKSNTVHNQKAGTTTALPKLSSTFLLSSPLSSTLTSSLSSLSSQLSSLGVPLRVPDQQDTTAMAQWIRELRSWSSVVIIGLLVSWVVGSSVSAKARTRAGSASRVAGGGGASAGGAVGVAKGKGKMVATSPVLSASTSVRVGANGNESGNGNGIEIGNGAAVAVDGSASPNGSVKSESTTERQT
ncbi:hypothetical protein AX16_007613 [Volvariella volvacea WC 439]|nr:hypothetical protein AX16_007613 [Volvariella volvacea WC 439]